MKEIIKAEFDIFALRKHKVNGWTKGTTNAEPGQRHSNKNIKPDRTSTDYLS